MSRLMKLLNYAVLAVEIAVTAVLVVLAGAVLLSLGSQMLDFGSTPGRLTTEQFYAVVGLILEVFILVELFRIAIAYMRHENVVPTVLEAALVAVARKFVVVHNSDDFLATALGMSAMLVAVAITWWMLARANACEIRG